MENNHPQNISHISTQDKSTSVTSTLYLADENQTIVSKSKLEHLKDLAEDPRLHESSFSFNNVMILISSGFLFSSLGAGYTFSSLTQTAKYACISGVVAGGLFFLVFLIKEILENKVRRNHKNKMVNKVEEILQQMPPKAK